MLALSHSCCLPAPPCCAPAGTHLLWAAASSGVGFQGGDSLCAGQEMGFPRFQWKWTAMGCLESPLGTRAVSKRQEVAGGGSGYGQHFGDCSAVLACCEFIYSTLKELPSLTERGKESSRAACPPTLILHTTDRKSVPTGRDGDKVCAGASRAPGSP